MDSHSTNRPWSSKPQQLVPEKLAFSLTMTLGVNEKTTYFRCAAARDPDALARGIAKLLPSPVRCFRIESENLSAADAARVTGPLQAGESVVALFVGQSELARELNNNWADCSMGGAGASYVFRHFVMDGVETPGFLATVHVVDLQDFLDQHGAVYRATAEEVGMLELLGTPSLTQVMRLGGR